MAIRITLLILFLLAAMGAAYYYLAHRPAHTLNLEVAYVLPPKLQMVDTPAEVRIVVGSLKSGERVEILHRTRNWAEVRTPENLTGWVENKDLLDSQTYESGQKMLRDLLANPAQAEGHTSGVVNLRLEPARDAIQLSQLPENMKVQIYGRRMLDRPAPDGQPSAAKVRDAWYQIRTDAGAGWVLGRFVALDFPEQLSPYAQGSNMVAWVVLTTVDDGGQAVPEYITADRLGTQEADFSHIRVFTWWIKNHKYVTAYVESDLNGYFPIRVAVVNGVHYFRLRLIDDQGQKFQKVYGLFDTITRMVGTVPGWESDEMPPEPESHHHNRSRRRRG
ncbi:MAG: SH3 domain-containing protein [Acidobacteriota bacterium]|nr:SH3 domain-containing protein [Acidobacteriota bacterium]